MAYLLLVNMKNFEMLASIVGQYTPSFLVNTHVWGKYRELKCRSGTLGKPTFVPADDVYEPVTD